MSELYATPYGKWSSSTAAGQIRLEYQFGAAEIADFLRKTQEKAVYPTLELPGDGVCVWAVPGEKMVPLGQISVPMVPQAVRTLAGKILDELETLHKNGLAMADFSPWLVWVTDDFKEVALFPTPSLEPQVKLAPNGTTAMPFAAADWERPVGSPDPVTADIYGFGCLLWFLLTGTNRKTSQMLASEFDPSLAAWDAFFDGCTRNNPARRFQTLEQVRAQIPTGARPTPGSVAVPPAVSVPAAPAKAKPASQLLSRRNLLIGGAGVVGLGALVALTRSCGSGVPGLGTPYRRGYGDTILSYQDRNYEGAKWVKAYSLPVNGHGSRNRITGWDDDNYWIYCGTPEVLIEYSNHSYLIKAKDSRCDGMLCINSESLVCSNCSGSKYYCSFFDKLGKKTLELSHNSYADVSELFLLDDYLVTVHYRDWSWVNYRVTNSRILRFDIKSNKLSYIPESDDKFYIHNKDGNPVPDYYAAWIYSVKTVEKNHAYGHYTKSLVELKNNIWTEISKCPFEPKVLYTDFRNGSLKGIVGADDKGRVFRFIGENMFQMDINTPTKETTLDIVQVWGVNIDKFWAMDSTGTIWQWENNNWRQVVRGMMDFSSGKRNFEFWDTWISPTGIAYGVTSDALYKLEF